MRHRSGFSAGPGARACRLDMAAAGFCGWNALAADVKVQSLVTAALPPVFRPSRSERGLWSLRLPDVKPPCILAPGLSPGAIFSPRNQIHCSSIAGPTRWFASRAASSVTSNSRCAHAPCPAVRHHALGQPPAARSARWWRGRRRRPPEDRRRWPHSIRPAPPQGHASATGASRSSSGSARPAMWSNMSSIIRWPSARNAPHNARRSVRSGPGMAGVNSGGGRPLSAAPGTAMITMAYADQGRAAGRAGASGADRADA